VIRRSGVTRVRSRRRLLKDIAQGRAPGDTTLADPTVVARLKDEYESREA
jgi:acetyl-CoA synthetase